MVLNTVIFLCGSETLWSKDAADVAIVIPPEEPHTAPTSVFKSQASSGLRVQFPLAT